MKEDEWTIRARLKCLQDIGTGAPDGKILKTSDVIKAVQVYTDLVGDGAPEKQEVNLNATGELRDLIQWLRSGQKNDTP